MGLLWMQRWYVDSTGYVYHFGADQDQARCTISPTQQSPGSCMSWTQLRKSNGWISVMALSLSRQDKAASPKSMPKERKCGQKSLPACPVAGWCAAPCRVCSMEHSTYVPPLQRDTANISSAKSCASTLSPQASNCGRLALNPRSCLAHRHKTVSLQLPSPLQ